MTHLEHIQWNPEGLDHSLMMRTLIRHSLSSLFRGWQRRASWGNQMKTEISLSDTQTRERQAQSYRPAGGKKKKPSMHGARLPAVYCKHIKNVLHECQDERLRDSSHFLSWSMLSLKPRKQMCPQGSLLLLSLSLPAERMYGHCQRCQIQCLLERICERIATVHCMCFCSDAAQLSAKSAKRGPRLKDVFCIPLGIELMQFFQYFFLFLLYKTITMSCNLKWHDVLKATKNGKMQYLSLFFGDNTEAGDTLKPQMLFFITCGNIMPSFWTYLHVQPCIFEPESLTFHQKPPRNAASELSAFPHSPE